MSEEKDNWSDVILAGASIFDGAKCINCIRIILMQ